MTRCRCRRPSDLDCRRWAGEDTRQARKAPGRRPPDRRLRMAIGILIEIPGGTQRHYDLVMEKLQLEGKPAPGGIFHVAGPMEGGWRVVDVWESQAAFEQFFR